MGYVRRDGGGSITACFALPQTSIVVEPIADDAPELLAFLNPPKPSAADLVEGGITTNPMLSALVRRLAKHEGITERELLDEIRAEAKAVLTP
jgi:hypothetical protein